MNQLCALLRECTRAKRYFCTSSHPVPPPRPVVSATGGLCGIGLTSSWRRMRRCQAYKVEPGAPSQTKISSAGRGFVQQGRAPRYVDGMGCERVYGCRAELHMLGGVRHFQQGEPRRLIEHVVINRHAIKAVTLGCRCQFPIRRQALIRLECDRNFSRTGQATSLKDLARGIRHGLNTACQSSRSQRNRTER